MLTHRLALVAALSLPVAGQEKAETRPLVEGHLQGPGAAGRSLLATNLGALLDREECAPIREQLRGMVTGSLGKELGKQLLEWNGTVHFRLTPYGRTASPRFITVLRLVGDTPTRFAAPLTTAMELAGLASGKPTPVTVGDRQLASWKDGRHHTYAPFEHDGELVIVTTHSQRRGGEELEEALRWLDRPVAPANGRNEIFGLSLDVHELLVIGGRQAFLGNLLDSFLPFESVETLQLSVRTAGPHVLVESALQFTRDDDRGLFGGFFPATSELSALVARVPEGAPNWKAGHLDLGTLMRTVVDALEPMAFFPDGGPYEAMKREIGFHILDDFLVFLTGEALLLAPASTDGGDIENLVDGTCMAFRIDDRAEFHKTWNEFGKRFAEQFSFGGTETETFDLGDEEVQVHVSGLGRDADDRVHFAAHRDLFLIGFGASGRELLESTLAMDPAAEVQLPKSMTVAARYGAKGLNGAARMDVGLGLGAQIAALVEALDSVASLDWSADGLQKTLAKTQPLLVAHNLNQVFSLTSYADRRWTLRILW